MTSWRQPPERRRKVEHTDAGRCRCTACKRRAARFLLTADGEVAKSQRELLLAEAAGRALEDEIAASTPRISWL
jgi:hypothetical protein